jgi:hypothetical protein
MIAYLPWKTWIGHSHIRENYACRNVIKPLDGEPPRKKVSPGNGSHQVFRVSGQLADRPAGLSLSSHSNEV